MRYLVFVLFTVCLSLKLVQVNSAACTSQNWKYNQLGQGFDINVEGIDPDNKRSRALKGSPDSPYVFSPSDVSAYYVNFTSPVKVESLKFQVKLMSSVTITAVKQGSNGGYTESLTISGNRWQPNKKKLFTINQDDTSAIVLTWVQNGSELGIRNLLVKVCN